jgi:hypothetical protein
MSAAVEADITDAAGKYEVNTTGGRIYHEIERQIANTSDVQSVVGGYDAQFVARVLINDATFKPSIYQMWAMDVNRDGKVTAGDLSQIMQRSVMQYDEFRQVGLYDDNGNKLGTEDAKDWLFAKPSALSGAAYRISSTYPNDDHSGYSKLKVPICADVYTIEVSGDACSTIKDESFTGIMLGDVDGSYAAALPSQLLKSTSSVKVLFDMSKAIRSEGSIEVPVYIASAKDVTSVDFALQLNEESMSYSSISKNISGFESADFFNADDRTLRFSSYSLKAVDPSSKFATVRFNTLSANVNASDLKALSAMVNGVAAEVAVIGDGSVSEVAIDVYPNPASDILNVAVSADATVVLMDLGGRNMLVKEEVAANQKKQLNISGVADGIYILKVYGAEFSEVKKVIIRK